MQIRTSVVLFSVAFWAVSLLDIAWAQGSINWFRIPVNDTLHLNWPRNNAVADYDYAPTAFKEVSGGDEFFSVWYCHGELIDGPGGSDTIYRSRIHTSYDPTKHQWGGKVLGPKPGTYLPWDSRHACNPTVVKVTKGSGGLFS